MTYLLGIICLSVVAFTLLHVTAKLVTTEHMTLQAFLFPPNSKCLLYGHLHTKNIIHLSI